MTTRPGSPYPPQAFASARAWLLANARPLEGRLFEAFFDGAPPEPALAELARFQNADGGFGHGLEPDLQTPASSAIATSVALQWLSQLGVAGDHSLVAGAGRYLVDTWHPAFDSWQIIPPEVADAPHAPWWTYRGDIERMGANPRAELVAYAFQWPSLLPAEIRDRALAGVLQRLEGEGEDVEMHDLLCYLRLARTGAVPAETRRRMLELLGPLTDAALDMASGLGYGLRVTDIVPAATDPLAARHADRLPDALARLIAEQQPEGYWQPSWQWGSDPGEGWARAEREWRGVLTLGNLLTLARHGAGPVLAPPWGH